MTEIIRIYKTITTEKGIPKVSDPEVRDAVELLVQSAIVTKVTKTAKSKKVTKFELGMNEEDAAVRIGKHSKLIQILSQ